jgi:hypothetical protein
MTEMLAVHTACEDSVGAAQDLAAQINGGMDGPADAIILFASSAFDYTRLLSELKRLCSPRLLMGSSSAGEFTHVHRGTGTASALAIRSSDLTLTATIGRNISSDGRSAARDMVSAFQGLDGRHPYRAAMVMTDALAGHAEALVDELTLLTSGSYLLAGGGAGDDAKFSKTHVFLDTDVYTDAAVALEILSHKPIAVGVGHGWVPAGNPMHATEVQGMRLVGIDGMPAVEAFEQHATVTGQAFDRDDPMPFFLHNILGIETGQGYRLRVPLSVNADGSVECAAEIPEQSRVFLMKTTGESASTAAARATRSAVEALESHEPGAALFFDCVATRLRLGDAFGNELSSVGEGLTGAPFVGCNTYGQIARSDGQFSGFHNCTAVVLVLSR